MLASLLQRKSAMKVIQAMAGERAEWQLPAFTRANPKMVIAVVLLDALPAPPTDGAGKVYQWLKSILVAAAT
jgi:hypothetical protein